MASAAGRVRAADAGPGHDRFDGGRRHECCGLILAAGRCWLAQPPPQKTYGAGKTNIGK